MPTADTCEVCCYCGRNIGRGLLFDRRRNAVGGASGFVVFFFFPFLRLGDFVPGRSNKVRAGERMHQRGGAARAAAREKAKRSDWKAVTMESQRYRGNESTENRKKRRRREPNQAETQEDGAPRCLARGCEASKGLGYTWRGQPVKA